MLRIRLHITVQYILSIKHIIISSAFYVNYMLCFVKLHSKLYIHAIYYFNWTKSVFLLNDTFT